MTAPEISCVIPAYENPDLLARCLLSVAAQSDVAMETIVSDDSRTGAARAVMTALADLAPSSRYVEGPRTGNPVDNWNAGLAEARGRICLLIHQDEFLVDPLYLRRAVDALDRTGAVAAIAGVTVIGVERPSRFGMVAPIARGLPGARGLLPVINWIGPTAAFPFRAGPKFDPSLVQMVDVEFYARALAAGRVVRLPGTSVGSLGHHRGQITARIDVRALKAAEIDLLAARNPPAISRSARWMLKAAMALRS